MASSPDDKTSYPLAAQIPLQSFTLPTFPAEASHLRALTITSDIKLDEYQSLVSSSTDTPSTATATTLPQSLTSLTLELFHLGFPSPFLATLANSLPNLTSLTLYSTLLDGLTPASRTDALQFFAALPLLQTLHIIDSFARPGFLQTVGETLSRNAKDMATAAASGSGSGGLKVIEVSYTFRGHSDADFLSRVGGEELPALLVPGCAGCSFNLIPAPAAAAAPTPEEDATTATNGESKEHGQAPEGILPFASDGRAAHALRARFERLSGGPLRSLAVLNLSMYALRPHEVHEALYSCAGGGPATLADLTVSVLLEPGWWPVLLQALAGAGVGAALESLELVGVPANMDEGEVSAATAKGLLKADKGDAQALRDVCPKLVNFEMSILRAKSVGSVKWAFEGADWKAVQGT